MTVDLIKPTPNAKIVRVSEVTTYRECKRKWDYQYRQKLGKVNPKIGAREYGTLFHGVMNAYYQAIKDGATNDEAQGKGWVAWATLSNDPTIAYEPEQLELFQGMIEYYFECYDPVAEGWEILYVEQRFYAKIPHTNTYLTGQFDVVAKIPGRGIVIMDHKTWGTFLSFDAVQHSTQLTSYIWLAQQNGLRVREAVYDMVKKSVPHDPLVLQKGGLSKDKKQASTKRRYLAKIHELGLKVEDYADFLAVWEEPKFHCRESVSRSITHLQNFEKNLTDEIREISSTRTKIVYNDSKQCIYCDYRPLCEEVNNGGDWKLIKQLDYKLVVVGNSPESEIDNDEV